MPHWVYGKWKRRPRMNVLAFVPSVFKSLPPPSFILTWIAQEGSAGILKASQEESIWINKCGLHSHMMKLIIATTNKCVFPYFFSCYPYQPAMGFLLFLCRWGTWSLSKFLEIIELMNYRARVHVRRPMPFVLPLWLLAASSSALASPFPFLSLHAFILSASSSPASPCACSIDIFISLVLPFAWQCSA